jgi:hypothetical protein
MNSISTIFNNPDCPRSQRNIDTLEDLSPELVQRIREAETRESASACVIQLLRLVDECFELEEYEMDSLKEWLRNMASLLNPDDHVGWSHQR